MPKRIKRRRRVHRQGGIDLVLLGVLCAMITFGLIMVFSASSPSAYYQQGDQFYYIKKQLIWTVAGFISMFAIAALDYRFIKRWAQPMCICAFVMMLLVPIMGVEVNGAKRWLGVGSFTFQPSEITKFVLIIYFSKRISEMPQSKFRKLEGLFPLLCVLGVFVVIMILQKHLSAIVVTSLTITILLIAGGANIKHFVPIGLLGAVGMVLAVTMEGFRVNRILAFLDPFKYAQGIGWQIVQGLYAIGSGGFFGRGLGQARQKFLYVPEAHNDYIYAILCEELGFVGAIAVAVLFVVFITRCIIIAMNAPDTFSRLTVFGIATLISLQYLINIGVVTSSIPNTGMQLPFFSAGGSSLVFLMMAMGVVLSISKNTKLPGKEEVEK